MPMPPIAPILASLQRHRLTTLLLILQVALTGAIVSNVTAMTFGRMQAMHPVSGLKEDDLLVVDSMSTRKAGFLLQTRVDIDAVRHLPGVVAATAVDSLPLSRNSWTSGVRNASMTEEEAAHHSVSIYTGFPGALDTLGLTLAEGRDFLPTEYTPTLIAEGYEGTKNASSVLVSRAVADSLWPGAQALGQVLYLDGHPLHVVGVLSQLLAPKLGTPGAEQMTIVLPLLPDDGTVSYVVRAQPGRADSVLAQVRARLDAVDSERVISHARTYSEVRRAYFRRDVTMIGLLLAAAIGLLFVTGLGIGGLASFWVQQRYRQIGIRRAIGATRADIRAHFQLENALIVGVGVVVGSLLAIGFNLVLMHFYEVAALPLVYLPATAVLLWVLGQVAVFSAAFRASHVPPVVAIRSA
jgi:putative ABC transport system permease protein